MSLPANEAPVGVAPFGQLASSETAWIGNTAISVYTSGVTLELSIRIRREPPGLPYRAIDVLMDHGRWKAPEEHRLWFGVQYADGRTGTNHARYRSARLNRDRVHLQPDGAHGNGRRYDTRFWMAPVPPAGPLTFVCAWPLYDISETQTVFDAAPLRQARAQARVLWPAEPTEPEDPGDPRPPSGWFADYL